MPQPSFDQTRSAAYFRGIRLLPAMHFLTNMGAILWSAELSRAAWSRSPFQRTYGMNCSEPPAFPNGKVILVFHAESAQPRSALIRLRRLPPSTIAQRVSCLRNRGTTFVADGGDAPIKINARLASAES